MSGIVTKRASDPLRFRVGFEAPLLGPDELIEKDAGWVLQRVNAEPEHAHVSETSCGPDWCEAVIEGGATGDTFLVTSRAETSAKRIVKHAFVLRIE